MAAFMAVAPITSALAQDKEQVSIKSYCEMQTNSQSDAIAIHNQYTPYSSPTVTVDVDSRVHGRLRLNHFNCETLIPACADGGFAATKGTLSSLHAALGKYNASDDPGVVAALRKLGNNTTIITPKFAQTSQSIKHLQDDAPGHGLDLFKAEGQSFDIGSTSFAIYSVCAANLINE